MMQLGQDRQKGHLGVSKFADEKYREYALIKILTFVLHVGIKDV